MVPGLAGVMRLFALHRPGYLCTTILPPLLLLLLPLLLWVWLLLLPLLLWVWLLLLWFWLLLLPLWVLISPPPPPLLMLRPLFALGGRLFLLGAVFATSKPLGFGFSVMILKTFFYILASVPNGFLSNWGLLGLMVSCDPRASRLSANIPAAHSVI